MKLQALYCPYCAGTVKFDIESGRNYCYCVHCGQQIYFDDEVARSEHKEIIEDKTYQWNKDKYENPRQCLYRITVIQQYDNNRSDDYSQIDQI